MNREINNIEEAKKYIDKVLYYIDVEKSQPTPLYVGGVYLFYNQADYDIEGFAVYEDKECKNVWGKVNIKDIKDKFIANEDWMIYCFSFDLAKQYLANKKIYEKERDKINAIENAREILDAYNVKYEIF